MTTAFPTVRDADPVVEERVPPWTRATRESTVPPRKRIRRARSTVEPWCRAHGRTACRVHGPAVARRGWGAGEGETQTTPCRRTRSRAHWRGVAMTQSSTAPADLLHADPEEEPAAPAGQPVTLVEGSTFAISGRSGDMKADGPEGLFFRDVRVLSTWRLRLDDGPLQVLDVLPHEPFRTTFLARVPPQSSSTELLVERRRYVGEGMREDLRVRNLGMQTVATRLRLDVDSDFADLFAVKEGRVQERSGESSISVEGETIALGCRSGTLDLGVRISA